MKPELLRIELDPSQSFKIRHDVVPYFYNKWHHHPEFELTYIIDGKGRQFIGNNVHHFKNGDMFLMGPHLPHLWRADPIYFEKNVETAMQAVVVHFLPDCFGESFFRLPENRPISELLFEKAKKAVRIKEATRDIVGELLLKMLAASGTRKIILLLEILDIVANSEDIKQVSEKEIVFDYSKVETDRMNTIYQYILKNFHQQITLDEIAKVAHMSPNAFCRYFKSRLKKTFSLFLIEVRVGHAAKLLAETNKSVADICYECGYNNFSNFNKHFKKIIQKTPLQHRKYYDEIKMHRMQSQHDVL